MFILLIILSYLNVLFVFLPIVKSDFWIFRSLEYSRFQNFIISLVLVLGALKVYREFVTMRTENAFLKDSLEKLNEAHIRDVQEERQKAVASSRKVIKGQISEQILPLLPDFPYNLADVRMFGKPIDYAIYDGLADGNLKEIILADVKTGGAQLTDSERQIRNAIMEGRFCFATIRLNEKGITVKKYPNSFGTGIGI